MNVESRITNHESRGRVLIGALCAVGIMCSTVQAQDAELKWKLAAGDVLVYEHTLDQKFKLSGDESSFEYAQKIEATERLEVERVTADGGYQVRVTTTRVRVTVDGRVVFDSDAPDRGDPQAAGLFQSAIGRAQAFTMTPAGRLAAKKGTTAERVQQSFSAGALGGESGLPMAILAVPLPEGPGRTWSVDAEEENENGTKMTSTSTYRLDGGSISGTTTLKLDKAPATMKLRDGAGRQRAVFDASAGMLRESDLDFTVALENQVEGKLVKVVNGMKTTTKLKERTRK